MADDVLIADGLDAAAGVEEEVVNTEVSTEGADEGAEETIEGEQPELSDEPALDDDAKAAKDDAELLKQLQDKGIPPKYKDLLKKEPFLRDSVMGYKAFRSEYPGGIKEANEFRAIAQEVGGREGIEALRAAEKTVNDLDSLIAEGKPEAIDAIMKVSAEGFTKLMPTALERFRQADVEQYNHVLGRVVFNTIKESAVVDAYHALVKAGDSDSAKKLAEFYNNLEALAAKQPEKKVDPEREKLQKERTEFEQKKQQDFTQDVSREMRTFNAKTMESELAKQFKAAGKDYEAFKKKAPDSVVTMLENCNNALLKEMEKDVDFVKNHNALIERKDKTKVVSMTQAKAAKVIPDVVKRVYRLFNAPGSAADKKVVTVGGKDGKPAPAGTIRLAKAPEPAKVDRQRTTDDMIFNNEAYLLGRKEKFVWA